jgi:peptidoglycan/LPS O-acetylase OafA/YrhL
MAEPLDEVVRGEAGSGAAHGAPVKAQRLAGLEGPRGVGCLCVIAVHVAVHFTPNVLAATRIDFLGQALTFFFALSGFLLYLPYVKSLARRRAMPNTGEYLRHRVLRVFPAYLVIFLLANFVFRAVYVSNPFKVSWHGGDAGTGMITDPVKLLAHLTLTQSLFPSTLQTGINPAWSLTTEWGFYLVLPVIGLALYRFARDSTAPYRAALWPPLVLLAIGVTTNVVLGCLQTRYYPRNILEGYWGDNWTAVLSRSFLALSDTFAFGMMAAVVFLALGDSRFRAVSTRRIQVIAAAAMTVGLVGSMALFVLNPRYLATVFAFASGCLILLIVAPIARNQESVIARMTDWAPMRLLGSMSLSVYLWHYPVLIVVDRVGFRVPDSFWGLLAGFLVVTAGTVVMGAITYRWVELPAIRYR